MAGRRYELIPDPRDPTELRCTRLDLLLQRIVLRLQHLDRCLRISGIRAAVTRCRRRTHGADVAVRHQLPALLPWGFGSCDGLCGMWVSSFAHQAAIRSNY